MNNVAFLSEILKEEIMKAKPKKKKPGVNDERVRLQINIGHVPGLYAALKKQAVKEMRSPTDQALWILKHILLAK